MHFTARVSVSITYHFPLHMNFQIYFISRYRTANLMCVGILPGPKEQNPDQIQQFLWPIVSNLLCLWKSGMVVLTESSPDGRFLFFSPISSWSVLGRVVHIILVAVVCDKPAAHKIGGLHHIPTPISVPFVGYPLVTRGQRKRSRLEVHLLHYGLLPLTPVLIVSISTMNGCSTM